MMRNVMLVVVLVAACGGKKDDAKQSKTDKEDLLGPVKKVPEAQLMLNRLGKSAKVYYATNAHYPSGKSAALPPSTTACCDKPDYVCPPTDAWAKDPVWSELEFSIEDRSHYQYTYEGRDANNAVVTAVGDLDCDGNAATYTLTLSAAAGNAAATLTNPPAGAL